MAIGLAAWLRGGLLLCGLEFHVYPYEITYRATEPGASVAVLLAVGGFFGFGAWRTARLGTPEHGTDRGSLTTAGESCGGLEPIPKPPGTGSFCGVHGANACPPLLARFWDKLSSDTINWKLAVWLLASAVIPLADALRSAGIPAPHTFLDPLWFAFVSGMAARQMVGDKSRSSGAVGVLPSAIWPGIVLAATVAFAWWCYSESVESYSDYQLGFADFGDHGRRVVNTWEGRGLLTRSPQWAPFFDHFDGGLVLLAPLWGLWPDARMFFVLQALCLAIPALCVYGIARRLNATPAGGAAWAGAYLVFPALGQLNLNFSYGWHDVSVALPLVAGAIWAYLADRRWLALGLATLACTFKEEVFVFLAGLAFGLTVLELRERRLAGQAGGVGGALRGGRATGLKPWQWLAVSMGFAAGFLVISRMFGLMENPTVWKFKNLGSTPGEIALSPLVRPREFWGQVFHSDSVYYLLAMLVPAGLPLVLRGWPILIALAAPWMVLLGWQFDAARSIAFQYVTIQIPIIFLAAMVGAARGSRRDRIGFDRLLRGGILALVTGIVASVFFGALPFSSETIPFTRTAEERARLAPYVAAQDRAVALVDRPDASVIASGRLAAHLLGVRRLEMVGFAMECLGGLAREAGPGRQWIEVFDWVAVDLNDRRLHHSLDELKTVVMAAEGAGYRLVMAQFGVLVYRRPDANETAADDPLATWRLSDRDRQAVAAETETAVQIAGLRVSVSRGKPTRTEASGVWRIPVELIVEATSDHPEEYQLRHTVRDDAGSVIESRLFLPVGGNRPTSWWKQGEAWRERYVLTAPSEYDPADLTHELRAEVVPTDE